MHLYQLISIEKGLGGPFLYRRRSWVQTQVVCSENLPHFYIYWMLMPERDRPDTESNKVMINLQGSSFHSSGLALKNSALSEVSQKHFLFSICGQLLLASEKSNCQSRPHCSLQSFPHQQYNIVFFICSVLNLFYFFHSHHSPWQLKLSVQDRDKLHEIR